MRSRAEVEVAQVESAVEEATLRLEADNSNLNRTKLKSATKNRCDKQRNLGWQFRSPVRNVSIVSNAPFETRELFRTPRPKQREGGTKLRTPRSKHRVASNAPSETNEDSNAPFETVGGWEEKFRTPRSKLRDCSEAPFETLGGVRKFRTPRFAC
jgi:hypothetical protein